MAMAMAMAWIFWSSCVLCSHVRFQVRKGRKGEEEGPGIIKGGKGGEGTNEYLLLR